MLGYSPVDVVAERLKVPVEKLWDFEDLGWISIVEKNGGVFIAGQHEYKAKFILHLQDVLKLNPQQISRVLFAEEPPYSLKDVERMLTETSAEVSHEGAD